jgi:hypothetical protein
MGWVWRTKRSRLLHPDETVHVMAMTHLNLNDTELALIRALREWPVDGRQLLLRRAEGEWFVAMKEAPSITPARGTGPTFEDAWKAMSEENLTHRFGARSIPD